MKNKRIFKTFSALCAALVLMMGLSVTAFAQGTEQPPAEDATNDENVVVEKTEDSPALTPEGNAALVDDFGGNKQLITVTTKAGNYFYILIDRANEDKETSVHFLNQVDDADLQALLEDGEQEPQACTCTAKCEAGAVNTACPVCKNNLTACAGPEPEPVGEEEPAAPEKESGGMGGLVVFLVVALAGGGVALYFFKLRKPKADVKGGDDLDEYDFGEAEGDEEEAPEPDDATDGYAQEPGEDLLMEEETDEEDEE